MRKANSTSFKPGHGGGRPKGAPNKRTLQVQKSVERVCDLVHKTPGTSLPEMAEMDPFWFYKLAYGIIDTAIRNE
jgi:hypothetical protein